MSTGLFQRPLRLTAAAALRPLLTARLLPTSPLASSYPHGRFLLPAVARVSPRRAAFSTANSTAPSSVEPRPQGPAAPADIAAARARELAESSSQQRRALILEEVQRADQDRSAVERLSFCVIDALGEIKHPHLSYTKGEICTTYNVHPRDTRTLDSNNDLAAGIYHGRRNLVATILPRRRECIIINLLYLRALIKHDQVILLDATESLDLGLQLQTVIRNNLQKHLRDKSISSEPFSYKALDSLLVSAVVVLEAEMTVLRHQVRSLLTELEKEISRDSLKSLLGVTRALSGLGERVGLVNDAVERCLVDDDILGLMDLSSPPLGRTDKGGLDEIELLLESISQRVEEVISEVQTTTSNVQSTQEIVELMLASSRNALIILDIKISLIMCGISFATLGAGFGGMNLLSGYEQDPHLFYDVTAGLVALALIVTAYGFRRLMILRRVGLGRARRSKTGDHPPRWWTVALARYFRAGDAAAGKTM